ncbi:LLM class flavin-dependent oxidoreductase [Nocardia sp. CNY236]|uniref:TIGR03619 family F420-dependent LLM class oxidoreductase n=1 Tax=Nocardia sp. CNY236 TaxID=1169152 RepID=UPI0009DFF62F|nr:LLM class flavin-dependent oxidoreductase [Nocardia sp. CNY236]
MSATIDHGSSSESGNSRFGIILSSAVRGLAVGNYPDMVRTAREAETLGFESIWLCDHFLTLSPEDYVQEVGIGGDSSGRQQASHRNGHSIPQLECWTALAALSRDTERIRLGTNVLCNSYRYPSVLAKMAATLDVISAGRVELGLGAGWFRQEFDAYGIPFPPTGDRVSALAESLQLIRHIWVDESPAFHGEYYAIDGAVCDPTPVQRPHPPLWVGGEGDRVHRIAARYADGINVRWWSPTRCADRRDFLDRACEKAGREPAALRLALTALLAPVAHPESQQRIRTRFRSIPADGLIIGSPEKCAARIREYENAGIRDFLFFVPDVADTEYLTVAGEEVIRYFGDSSSRNDAVGARGDEPNSQAGREQRDDLPQ